MPGQQLGSLHLNVTAGTAKFSRQMKVAEKGVKSYATGVVKSNRKIKAASKGVNTFTSGLKKLGVAMAAFITISAGLGVLKTAAANFADAEEKAAALAVAMSNQGSFTIEAARASLSFSSALQKQSRFGDEAITAVQTLLITLGDLSGDKLKRATLATLDFATSQKKDLKQAAEIFGKAASGNVTALTRYIGKMELTGDAVKDFDNVLEKVEKRMGGSALAAMNTQAGKLDVIKEKWADLTETLGRTGVTNIILDQLQLIVVEWEKIIRLASGLTALAPGAGESQQLLDDISRQLKAIKREKEIREAVVPALKRFVSPTLPGKGGGALVKLSQEDLIRRENELLAEQLSIETAIEAKLKSQKKERAETTKIIRKSTKLRFPENRIPLTNAEKIAVQIDLWFRRGGKAREEMEKMERITKSIEDATRRQAELWDSIGERIRRAGRAAGDALTSAAIGGAPILGGAVAGAQQGAQFGPEGAAVGAIIGLFTQSEQFASLMEAINKSLGMTVDLLGSFIDPFAPVIALMSRLQSILLTATPAMMFLTFAMDALTPVMKILFGVFKTLGIIVLKVAKFFATVIPGLSSRKINKALKELEETTFDNIIARDKETEAIEKVTEALTNVPSGFKVALQRFRARDADFIDPGGGGGGGGVGTNIPGPEPVDPDKPDQLGTSAGAATSEDGGGMHIHFHGLADPERMADETIKAMERRAVLRSGSSQALNPFSTGRGRR